MVIKNEIYIKFYGTLFLYLKSCSYFIFNARNKDGNLCIGILFSIMKLLVSESIRILMKIFYHYFLYFYQNDNAIHTRINNLFYSLKTLMNRRKGLTIIIITYFKFFLINLIKSTTKLNSFP